MKKLVLSVVAILAIQAQAAERGDYLIQMKSDSASAAKLQLMLPARAKVEALGLGNWFHVTVPSQEASSVQIQSLRQNRAVAAVENNGRLHTMESPSLVRARFVAQHLGVSASRDGISTSVLGAGDNPTFPPAGSGGGNGADPDFSKQWGMVQNNVKSAWEKTTGSPEVIVAVIDTGVDYTHEDLVQNMWRNTKEIEGNGIDDDGNGYIDDIVGWDFAMNDNKPYDKSGTFLEILGGANPGHGTHCAGNVAARADNGKGIVGVAPNVRIMAMRFLGDKGGGTTADAVKAIKYAVDNGAKVLSNSWGSEGAGDAQESKALRDAIQYSMDKGVLFIAAAGNGHNGKGYNNDTDANPAFPASYDLENIISVAAIDSRGSLGSFSNWGARTVDIGAPGVVIYSTVPGNRYQDKIGSFMGQQLTWDGTSMAAPHVAGAAALYWSAHPEKTWQEVKQALLTSVKKTSVLSSKVSSGGQLDVLSLMNQ